MRKQEKILRIACSVLFFAAVAAMGTAFVDTSSEWYQSLIKPAFQPPPIVFSVVWTVLYLLLAASLSLVSIMPGAQKKTLALFILTGVLNVLWTYTFFNLQNPGGAFFVLIITIIAAIVLFSDVYRYHRIASYLLIPYMLWLCFAIFLNYEIAFFN
jgi:tryptophan-rich sensory protein